MNVNRNVWMIEFGTQRCYLSDRIVKIIQADLITGNRPIVSTNRFSTEKDKWQFVLSVKDKSVGDKGIVCKSAFVYDSSDLAIESGNKLLDVIHNRP